MDQREYIEGRLAIIRRSMELNETLYEKSKGYNSAIILAGYGGLFALLASTKDMIPEFWRYLAASLMSVSLLVFVGYVIFSMYLMSTATISLAKRNLLEVKSFNEELNVDVSDIESKILAFSRTMIGWHITWILSTFTGVAAAVTMMVFYFLGLLPD